MSRLTRKQQQLVKEIKENREILSQLPWLWAVNPWWDFRRDKISFKELDSSQLIPPWDKRTAWMFYIKTGVSEGVRRIQLDDRYCSLTLAGGILQEIYFTFNTSEISTENTLFLLVSYPFYSSDNQTYTVWITGKDTNLIEICKNILKDLKIQEPLPHSRSFVYT